jgi:uncharacterized membrane protein YvlD (DUF360 family)
MIALKDAIGGLCAQFIETPVSTLMNSVKGLIGALDDSVIKPIITAAVLPLISEVGGLVRVIGARLSPTLANKIGQSVAQVLIDFLGGAPSNDVVITLINNLLGTNIPHIDFKAFQS